MSARVLTLEMAKTAIRAGSPCRAEYFGKGWSVVWHEQTQDFYDLNPVTGSLHQHRFEDRDNCRWFITTPDKEKGAGQ